jgi:putative tricarboxylic transport membrane protein
MGRSSLALLAKASASEEPYVCATARDSRMSEQVRHRPGERLFLWLLLAFSVFILITAVRIPQLENLSSSGAFPIFIGSVLILSTLRVLWRNRKHYAELTLREESRQVPGFVLPLNVVGYALVLLLYILTTAPLHFLPSSFGFLVVSFIFLKGTTPVRSLIVAAVTLACIYALFHTVFRVILW